MNNSVAQHGSATKPSNMLRDCQCRMDEHGMITQLSDADGRMWHFRYDSKRIVAFTDPSGISFVMSESGWKEKDGAKIHAPSRIGLNQSTGEILIEDAQKTAVYKPDGSTVVKVLQLRGGEPIHVLFNEYATQPVRSFVVVEHSASSSEVTWIQDANGKLYKFEYDNGKMIRYVDLSSKPSVVWTAHYDAAGQLTDWTGVQRDGAMVGKMEPHLIAVDVSGNRQFVKQDGYRFTIGPSGAAMSDELLAKSEGAASAPILNVNGLPLFTGNSIT